MRKVRWGFLLLALWSTGCAASRVACDQDGLRKAVLELNTNQIIDNLIRLDKGLPIIHIDYSQLTGQITDSVGGEGDFVQTVHNAQALPLLITREITNMWSGKLTASRSNQVSVIGQPVTSIPEVYHAYLRFYAKPGRLMKTPEPPPPGEAILVRCTEAGCDDAGCGGPKGGYWWCRPKAQLLYYWVPCAFKDDFRELCLYAVALRGEVQGTPDYFEVTVLGVTDAPAEEEGNSGKKEKKAGKDQGQKGQITVVVVLDKKVPNAKGYMIATVKGRIYEKKELIIRPYITKETPAAKPPAPGEAERISLTDRLLLTFAYDSSDKRDPESRRVQATPEDAIQDLTKQTVRIRFERFSPPAPKTSDLLQQIRNQLELIRLGQQLQRAP